MGKERSATRQKDAMHKKIFNSVQMLNMLFQALYTLGLPIAVGAGLSFLLTKYASAPSVTWAILLTVGVLVGLYSMIKYILFAISAQKRLDEENERADLEKEEKESRQAKLRDAGKDLD